MNPLAIVGFMRSPMGIAIAIGAVLIFTHGYAYNAGKGRAEAASNAASLQSEVDALRRDLAAAKASERIAERLQEAAEAREQTLSERLTTYESTLAKGGEPDVCLLDDGDVDSLRKLIR